jgi:hypothetical protein
MWRLMPLCHFNILSRLKVPNLLLGSGKVVQLHYNLALKVPNLPGSAESWKSTIETELQYCKATRMVAIYSDVCKACLQRSTITISWDQYVRHMIRYNTTTLATCKRQYFCISTLPHDQRPIEVFLVNLNSLINPSSQIPTFGTRKRESPSSEGSCFYITEEKNLHCKLHYNTQIQACL